MKRKSTTTIVNIIIIVMLSSLLTLTVSYGNAYVFSFNNEGVIYEGDRSSTHVTLMFNIYQGTEEINKILELLDSYEVKTTFFLGGIWAEKNMDIIKEMIKKGHELGNHGYLHLDQDTLDYNQNYEEIYTCHNLIKVHTGYEMNLFAPPSGAYNNATIQASQALGYSTIMWSKDTIDWRDQDANLIFKRATNNVTGGELILMHPTPKSVEALPVILEFYKINNLKVVPVSTNINN